MAGNTKDVEARLFPELPEDLSDDANVSDEDLQPLLKEHEVAANAIRNKDEDYLEGLSAQFIVDEVKGGVEQTKAVKAEIAARAEGAEEFDRLTSELSSEITGEVEETDDGGEGD